MKTTPRTIVVDLTPLLPGGENGGAKIFVLDLVRRLGVLYPETQFVLLIQAASRDEMAPMALANISCHVLQGPSTANALRPRLEGLVRQLLPYVPDGVRRLILRMGYGVNRVLKRGGSGGLLREIGADLLFCPFTAPTYFEPGIPVVCTIYDVQYKTYPYFFEPEDLAHRDQTFKDACGRATALGAISEYAKKTAIFYGSLDPERIRTIHLRMARRISARPGENLRVLDRLGLAPQQYVFYPANFWKHKNHEMLLTAFGMACHSGLDEKIKLVCTGAPGPRQVWLARAAARIALGLQSTLHLGNLNAKRDWGHAKDYVRMQWMMLQQEAPDDFVIATGEQHSIREFCDLTFGELGIRLRWEGEGVQETGIVDKIDEKAHARLEIDKVAANVGDVVVRVDPRYFRPTEVESLLGDPSKAREKLGWVPEITFPAMVREMLHADVVQARRDRLCNEHGFGVCVYNE